MVFPAIHDIMKKNQKRGEPYGTAYWPQCGNFDNYKSRQQQSNGTFSAGTGMGLGTQCILCGRAALFYWKHDPAGRPVAARWRRASHGVSDFRHSDGGWEKAAHRCGFIWQQRQATIRCTPCCLLCRRYPMQGSLQLTGNLSNQPSTDEKGCIPRVYCFSQLAGRNCISRVTARWRTGKAIPHRHIEQRTHQWNFGKRTGKSKTNRIFYGLQCPLPHRGR